MERMTSERYGQLVAAYGKKTPRRTTTSKYRNQKTVVDGITFDSKLEATRYGSLKMLEKAGRITDLRLQPRYSLRAASGAEIATYVGDFQYTELGEDRQFLGVVCEDAKGVRTDVYKLKIKWAKADYPHIDFREVKKA